MNKLVTYLVLVLVISSLSLTYTQTKTDNFKLGLQFTPSISANEFPLERRIKSSWTAKAFGRFGLTSLLNAEVSAGYEQYAGNGYNFDYYKSILFPVDFRLLLKLMDSDTYPYLFAGVGGAYYKVDYFPFLSPSPKEVNDKGFTGFAPMGVGVQIDLGKSVALDFNMGFSVTTTDNLNYYKDGSAFDSKYFTGIGLLFGSNAPSDNDFDGLTDDQEEQLGTNPDNADSDGDGLKDGEEVNTYRTDPLKTDTDGDRLSDGDEVLKYKTDPLNADTDNDGLRDGDELGQYSTNPLKADTDRDGLKDGDEVLKYKTDPLEIDTDRDGLTDGDEVTTYTTDPLNADTDGDGLSDGDEVLKYKTDPLKADTDGGSVNDGTEVNRGTDPLKADDDVIKVGAAIILEGITFETNSAKITPESEQTLQKSLMTLKNNPDITVQIAGHTDNVGSNASNKKLSLKRAQAVMQWLVSKGIPENRLTAVGYGEEKPIVTNDNPENRQKNRRIEFIRVK